MLYRNRVFWLCCALAACGTGRMVASSPSGEPFETEEAAPIFNLPEASLEESEADRIDRHRRKGLSESFIRLLMEARLEFDVPDGFAVLEIAYGGNWPYDCALVSASGRVEIQFRVIPNVWREFAADTSDENAMTSEKRVSMNILDTMLRITGGQMVPGIQFQPESEARRRFNADLFATALFQSPAERSHMDIGVVGAIHHMDRGTVILVSFLNDMNDAQTRGEWTNGMGAVRFSK